jgi:large subunit ribosomal protein L7/L12
VEAGKKESQIITMLEVMTMLEVSGLLKKREVHFGVTGAIPRKMGGGGGRCAAAAVVEEKTELIVPTLVGDKKIQVIKVVREVTGLGLKEAKDLVDGAPKPVKEKVSKEEAQTIKQKLEENGAAVEIR